MSTYSDLLYIEKVKDNKRAFGNRVISMANDLGINPNWIMGVMNSESGINHLAVNPYSNATGLIQFMPNTAKGLGTSIEALKSMSNVEQLEYVQKYFAPHRSKIKQYHDLYAVVFYPYSVGKPDDYVFGSQNSESSVSIIAKQNHGMDYNKDGRITIAEFKKFALRGLPEPFKTQFQNQEMDDVYKVVGRNKIEIIIGIALVLSSVLLFIKYRKTLLK